MIIKQISAKRILDSRKQPTIQVSINNQKASAPAGKSTGKYETLPYHRSLNWNIEEINNLNELRAISINSFSDLNLVEKIIREKFHFKDTKQFGANALVALEIAILKALAKSEKKQLWQVINPKARKFPIPLGNAIGGGLHSHNKDAPEFQEFLIIPQKKTIKENYKIMKSIHKKLSQILKSEKMNDEGAWQTSLSNEQILGILKNIKNIRIGFDIAASSFYKNRKYNYKRFSINSEQQIFYINSLIKAYNLFYIEDPLQEEDFQGFKKIKHSLKHLITGDDLTATQISRVKKAIKNKSINALIIKPNQNGSLLELKEIFDICKKHNIKTILSHRSGETLDTALADLAFGFQADFIKTGIATKWRKAKLKRLIQIGFYLVKM